MHTPSTTPTAALPALLAQATTLLRQATTYVGSKAWSPGLTADIHQYLAQAEPATGPILQAQHAQVFNDALELAATLCEANVPRDADGNFKVGRGDPQSKEDLLLARTIRARKVPVAQAPAASGAPAAAAAEEPATLVCGHCHADRLTEPCRGKGSLCSMVGTAHDARMFTPAVRHINQGAAA
jgi:hypothetical protein